MMTAKKIEEIFIRYRKRSEMFRLVGHKTDGNEKVIEKYVTELNVRYGWSICSSLLSNRHVRTPYAFQKGLELINIFGREADVPPVARQISIRRDEPDCIRELR